jgi:hypothetical protein
MIAYRMEALYKSVVVNRSVRLKSPETLYSLESTSENKVFRSHRFNESKAGKFLEALIHADQIRSGQ